MRDPINLLNHLILVTACPDCGGEVRAPFTVCLQGYADCARSPFIAIFL